MGVADCDNLARFIIRHCFLVVISASDSSAAHRIFRVLNTRGLELTPPDILKSDVIGEIHNDEGQREYSQKWESIEEELGRDEFTKLFAHIYVIYKKGRHHKELAEAFQEDVLDKAEKGKGFIDGVLKDRAEDYQIISNAEYEVGSNANEINRYLQYLGWLDEEDWIPPVMEFFACNRNDDSAFLEFLKNFERLAYGLFLLRTRRDPRIGRYAKILSVLEEGKSLLEENGPLALSRQEKRSILQTLDGEIYQKQISRFTLPLLLRLDSLLAEAGANYNHKVITVEHVLPQNPDKDSVWTSQFSQEDREEWTHRLANLVLLSRRKNSQANNREFEHKKATYFMGQSSTFAITSKVILENDWSVDVLKRRQKELIDIFESEWRLS